MPLEPVIVPGSQAAPAPDAPAVTPDVVPAGEGRPPPVAGLYGKLPARGDFVERRLSGQFIDRWDRFLNEGMVAASGVLGDRFTDLYLVSPFWRFALGAGVAGEATVVGVFAPSVDRVGRYFPLTIATELPAPTNPLAALAAAESWLPGAEALIFEALGPEGSFEALDDGVSALAVTEPPPAGPSNLFIPAVSLSQALAVLVPMPPVAALFWTLGSATMSPGLITFGELPAAARFAAFLDGAWEGTS